jgi:hypothetical protein
MRGMIQILSILSLLLGAPVALLGAVAMLYAKLAPAQPPPSLNEGPGLAGFFGFSMTIFGLVSVLAALAMLAGLRRWPKPDAELQWARRHKRLW